MIKINLMGEKKTTKAKRPSPVKLEVGSGGRNLLFAGIVIAGLVGAAGWSWMVGRELEHWQEENRKAQAELDRLKPIVEEAARYEQRKEQFQRKINLITELKKRQAVPVHILDQVSRNLPDFLWLNKMTAGQNQVSISGKATTYNAVSNFYRNLSDSGFFRDVTLGRTFEVPEGVSFSLTCVFAPESQQGDEAPAEETAQG